MSESILIIILSATLAAGTPLIFAALGELVVEKSGVLNLGVEGLMAVGAVCGFITAVETGSTVLAITAAALAGVALSAVFAVLTLVLMANQVAAGLALTLFGIGLSAFLGQGYLSVALPGTAPLLPETLQTLPVIGKLLFSQTALVYLGVMVFVGVVYFLNKTRAGLILKAVGESPQTASNMGFSVLRIRFLAVLFGGAMAGIGGGYLSVVYTPLWAEGMVAGRGWIALALVVFATWRPSRVLLGAYLFGGITIAQFHVQSMGIGLPSQLLSALPYLATIAVLVVISRDKNLLKVHAPASLGKAYHTNS